LIIINNLFVILTFDSLAIPSLKTLPSISAKLFLLKSNVSSNGKEAKLSGGKCDIEFSDKINVCREFSNPRQESGSIVEI